MQTASSDDFFENKIRPILASRCLACHGESSMGGLRLDSREGVLKGGATGPAIIPGQPEQSLLIQAVSHRHERFKMPFGGEKLEDSEIAELITWVTIGAPWPDATKSSVAPAKSPSDDIPPDRRAFWSFLPCHKPTLPEVKNRSWPKSPIDYFVMARLESANLKPVGAADKRTLIRRATFDLIGLPPTFGEVDAFIKDNSPDAFAKIVDRLLASPHYGERWGRYWLDVARYAEDDTRGIGQEKYPNAFRYRDWVIGALNEDMPYDFFVKAQIAGDLLGEKGRERYLPGLGYFGLGPWYYDMAEPPQARADERHDRVDALTRGFLGLTVACARCHNHKFDPVSMHDYYALAGVFASSEYREYPLAPESVVEQYNHHQKKVKDLEASIREFVRTQGAQLAEILARETARYITAAWQVLSGPKSEPRAVAESEKLDLETLQRWITYLGEPQKEHPYLKAWNEALAGAATPVQVQKVADDFQAVLLALLDEKKTIDEENRVILAQSKPKRHGGMTRLPNGFVTYDDYCPGCNVAVKSIERDKFVLWSDLFDKPFRPEADDKEKKQTGVLLYAEEKIERFLSGEWKSHLESLRAELEALKKTLPPAYPYLHGIGETEKPVNLRLHVRGSPYNLGEEVPRRFLAVLSEGETKPFTRVSGRLELAEAVIKHPMAARVIINRIWKHHFGQGIVASPSNFGQLGERPTHPELLEYLASRLVENRWSIKALHREIMLSATYQSSGEYSETNSAVDPDNKLLWRVSRRRLDAEALRDALLFVAESLDLTLGGASADLTAENKRRTVYGRISRFQPDPTLVLFDFPSPSITSEQRNVTHVPLQRLFFLNSDLIIRQSQALADRLQADGDDEETRIKKAYRFVLARDPSESELQLGLEFLKPRLAQSDGNTAAWQQYVHVLLSSNEFSFVD